MSHHPDLIVFPFYDFSHRVPLPAFPSPGELMDNCTPIPKLLSQISHQGAIRGSPGSYLKLPFSIGIDLIIYHAPVYSHDFVSSSL